MTVGSVIALFSAMVVLAAIPSMSVLAVITKSASSGLMHGLFTTLGIILGDIIFIIIAIWGLSFLVESLGSLFVLVKYLGGAYLIWLGLGLCQSKFTTKNSEKPTESSLLSSFLTGFSITLADQKATLFYLGFFPAFLDISNISYFDTSIIIATTVVAVGSVKLAYAFMANRARLLIRSKMRKGLNAIAGCMMIAVGIFLILKP